jgi:uncharacterized membrane protein YgcG
MYRTHDYADKVSYAKTYTYAHGGDHPYSPGKFTPPAPGMNRTVGPVMSSEQLYAPVVGIWTRAGRVMSEAQQVLQAGQAQQQQVNPVQSVLVLLNGSLLPQSYGPPTMIWLNITVPVDSLPTEAARRSWSRVDNASVGVGDAVGGFDLEVSWAGKRPTRLPESIWLETRPMLPTLTGAGEGLANESVGWKLEVDKLGTVTDTADVVMNGGAALHAVSPDGLVAWRNTQGRGGSSSSSSSSSSSGGGGNIGGGGGGGGGGSSDRETVASPSLTVQSLDAALVAPGSNTNIWYWNAYNSPGMAADPQDGAAFCLFNNLYHTNYVLWYPWRADDAASRFRFRFRVAGGL